MAETSIAKTTTGVAIRRALNNSKFIRPLREMVRALGGKDDLILSRLYDEEVIWSHACSITARIPSAPRGVIGATRGLNWKKNYEMERQIGYRLVSFSPEIMTLPEVCDNPVDLKRVPFAHFLSMGRSFNYLDAQKAILEAKLELPRFQDGLGVALSYQHDCSYDVQGVVPPDTTILFPHEPIDDKIVAVSLGSLFNSAMLVPFRQTFPYNVWVAGINQGSYF